MRIIIFVGRNQKLFFPFYADMRTTAEKQAAEWVKGGLRHRMVTRRWPPRDYLRGCCRSVPAAGDGDSQRKIVRGSWRLISRARHLSIRVLEFLMTSPLSALIMNKEETV